MRRARKSIAAFKLREGMPVGVAVTLRGERGYEFLDRLISIAIPRIRDFRGLNPRSFDGRGNYSMGVKEQIIFPEIDYDAIDQVRGLDITITTSAATDVEAFALLAALGMPFAAAGPPARAIDPEADAAAEPRPRGAEAEAAARGRAAAEAAAAERAEAAAAPEPEAEAARGAARLAAERRGRGAAGGRGRAEAEAAASEPSPRRAAEPEAEAAAEPEPEAAEPGGAEAEAARGAEPRRTSRAERRARRARRRTTEKESSD